MARNITRGLMMLDDKKPADRSFILLGKVAQGKSSLANLIVEDSSGKYFTTHNPVVPNSVVNVSKCNTHVTLHNNEEIVINILDQCGFNDTSISHETHKKNIIKCILNSNAKLSVNYLIVIDLSRPQYEHEQYSMLEAINEWLTNESYTFSDNAVIVFTHKDVLLEEYRIVCEACYPQALLDNKYLLCDDCSEDKLNLNTIRDCKKCRSKALNEGRLALRHHEFGQCQIKCYKCENGTDHPRGPCEFCVDNKLYSILTAKRNTDEWYYINKTLELIPKFIIINTLDMSERVPVLRRLVDITTPTLKILFHGNDDFSSKKIKEIVKNPKSKKPAENPIKHKGFNLDFCYNPDYSAFKPPEEQIHAETVDQMKEGLQLVNSVSVIMIMINLNVLYSNAFNNFISSISKDYKNFNSEEDWWKYAVLIFYKSKTPADVSKILGKNGELKALVNKVSNRYIIMQDNTSKDEFLDSVTRECLKVKQINKGKDFVKKLKKKIDDNSNIRKMSTADYSTRVVFIHGNSNFPSSLLFKHFGKKINHSAYYATNYNNKTLNFFFQPDIVSYSGQKYDINHNYKTELPNMAMPLLVNYFILISYNDTYTQAMHKEIANIPNLYDAILNGKLYVIILAQNSDDAKNLKNNKDLAALINNIAKNRYGIITANNNEHFEIKTPDTCNNDLEDTWRRIMSVIMLEENLEICNNQKEAKISTKQIVRSFVIIGDDEKEVMNLLNNQANIDESTSTSDIQTGTLITKLTNDQRGFEIINISGINNADIAVEKWYKNLKLAIEDSNPCISHSFLIVFNLSEDYISHVKVELISGFLKIMNQKGYNINSKTVLIFKYNNHLLQQFSYICNSSSSKVEPSLFHTEIETNGTKIWSDITETTSFFENGITIDKTLSDVVECSDLSQEHKIEEILRYKISTDKWKSINCIVQEIESRLFVNSIGLGEGNKQEAIENFIHELASITKPTISLILHGNTQFSKDKIIERLNCNYGGDHVEIPHKDFKLHIKFTKDYINYADLKKQIDYLIEGETIDKIIKDKTDSDGICVVVFLIKLHKQFDHAMRIYIERMIENYAQTEPEIWKHVVFIFEASEGTSEASVNSNIYHSKTLKEFAITHADSKYILINKGTESEDLINKLVAQGIKVFAKSKGKDKINKMLADQIIDNSLKNIKKKNGGKVTPESVNNYDDEDLILTDKSQEVEIIHKPIVSNETDFTSNKSANEMKSNS